MFTSFDAGGLLPALLCALRPEKDSFLPDIAAFTTARQHFFA